MPEIPSDPAVVAAHVSEQPTVESGVISTDANGSGYFEVVYPASSSTWARVLIVARAKGLGVEAEETFVTTLPVLAERIDDITDSPPNETSPYGTSTSCADEL